MARIPTYPSAGTLTGTEELVGVQSAASVKLTPEQFKQLIKNPRYLNTSQTAVAGDFIVADTSGGAITITLPLTPLENQIVSVYDGGGNAATDNITVDRNGNTITGLAENFIIDENYARVDFIYDGSTWQISLATPGAGLTEAQVDARVVTVASGTQQWFLRAKSDIVAGSSTESILTLGVMEFPVLSFADGAFQDSGISLVMPGRWDEGSFRAKFYWSPSSTNTGTCNWSIYSAVMADLDAVPSRDLEVNVSDAGAGTANVIQISDWSSAFTVTGANVGELVHLSPVRAGDTDPFSGAARLIGIMLEWTSNAPTDD